MSVFMYIIIILAVIALALLICGIVTQFFPVAEKYEIMSEQLTHNRRFVLLTDLHAVTHGENNSKLLAMIQEAQPDFVCIAGDMTVKNALHTENALHLLGELAKRYPVYYAPGNHEIRMPVYEEYKKRLVDMGIHYLENQSVSLGSKIIVYGLDLPEYWYHKFWEKRSFTEKHIEELLGKCAADSFSILLAHNPEYGKQYAKWGADLTLSGHVHGGIMRLPLLGGVISPSLQLFPHYDAGLFEENGKKMIVSRGLGLHHIRLRFFNRPEISIINLTCQQQGK